MKIAPSLLTASLFILTIGLFAGLPAGAQPLMVYSDLAQLDAKGQPVKPEFPREIISPLAVRNATLSLQVVVSAAEGKRWQFYVAQNPDHYMGVTLYRENGDRLEPVAGEGVSGSGTQVFWLDLKTPSQEAPPETGYAGREERIKVEPQLNIDNDWVIYPMEVRVTTVRVPNAPATGWPAGTASAEAVMRGFLCGTPFQAGARAMTGEVSIAQLRFRNAQQDRALASLAPREELQKQFGSCDAAWPADNPERMLRIRDFLFTPR